MRSAPLPGNAILTEHTTGAPVVLGTGIAVASLLAALLWLLAQVGALYREVDRLARTDSLTGVANRRAWDEELPRELARAARSGQPLCLALLDLDHFNAYNDQHGHQAGTGCSRRGTGCSRRRPPPGRRSRARPTCWPATAGGVLAAAARLPAGQRHGDRRAAPHRPARGHLLDRGGRLGRPRARDELITRADRALYAAKAGGRNRCLADRVPAGSRVP